MSAKDHKKGSTTSLHQKLNTGEGSDEAVEMTDELEEGHLLERPSYEELQKKLTEAEEKGTQSWERMLRTQAETENSLRRAERDVVNAHKFALEKFVNELLPVIDSLERAVTLPGTDEAGSVLEGVHLTLKMLYNALEKFGVQQVNPVSQAFNPEQHQAVSTQPDPNVAPGTVLNVLQKGYLLNNRLVRPALVIVSNRG